MNLKEKLVKSAENPVEINHEEYSHLDVKRGLRNADGTGVLAGLTGISNVHGYNIADNEVIPDEGRLTIRGYNIEEIIKTVHSENRFGFEEIAFALLFGHLPTQEELDFFQTLIDAERDLPYGFVKSLILKAPSDSIMNMMARSILNLHAFDPNADDTSWEHEVDVAISTMSRLSRIAPLSYHAYRAETEDDYTMVWHGALDGLSTAETILYMLRPDQKWTRLEAEVLDAMLIVHTEHGGGNNSTFACRMLTSSGTDAYSAYAGAVCSLKGPKHGGASAQVADMVRHIMNQVDDWTDEGQVVDYLRKILNKEAYDNSGLIYGIGHAVYTLSDPRAKICHAKAKELAKGTEWEDKLKLIETIEQRGTELLYEKKGIRTCANVDLYSGFVYEMLGIPEAMFTPLFATARITGWAAHRFEEMATGKRIIRPAYKSVTERRPYVSIKDR